MKPVEFAGLRLDVCGKCAGIWFDSGELASLAKEAPALLQILEDKFVPEISVIHQPEGAKRCPRCKKTLEKFRYQYSSPTLVDSCKTCGGVFIEDNELHAIKQTIDEKDHAKVTAAMEARGRLTGFKGTHIGKHTKEGGVAALLHALRHWRSQSPRAH